MAQREIDLAVASVTGESPTEILRRGFTIADPLEVCFDPEPRRPLFYDWDTRCPAEWPGL